MPRLRIAAAGVCVAALVVAGCSTNPATGEREFNLVSEEQEVEIGKEAAPEIEKELGGRYKDERVQAYVSEIGMKIASASARPDLPWSFTVVNAEEPNAMALPGGPIFVTRGLLAIMESEAELAGMLGHEVAHTALQHQAQQISKSSALQALLGIGGAVAGEGAIGQAATTGAAIAGQLLLLRYSREMEFEADRLSIESVPKVGWDPRGLPASLATLMRVSEAEGGGGRSVPTFLETHPATEDRIERAEKMIRNRYDAAELARLTRDTPQFAEVIAPIGASSRPEEAEGREVPAGTRGRGSKPPEDR